MFNDQFLERRLLALLSLEDILELNNLTEEDVLEVLLEGGYIHEPEELLNTQGKEED